MERLHAVEIKLKEIVGSYHWEMVEAKLCSLYPELVDSTEGLKIAFANIQQLKSENTASKMRIVVEEYLDKGGEPWYDISGCDGTTYGDCSEFNDDPISDKERKEEVTWSLDFRRWEKWLGMTIDEKTVKEYTGLAILAHCLYEMTWMGYTQEDINFRRKALDKTTDAHKDCSEEEGES